VAWCGMAWAWRGVAWRGVGVAWRGVAWRGVAWAWRGVARCCNSGFFKLRVFNARVCVCVCAVAWRGMVWRGVVLFMESKL
jgi:hypothetical protein